MMKSLKTIQKTFHVFQTLSRIAMILSFVWAGLSAVGLICGIVMDSGVDLFGMNQELLYSLTVTGGMTEMIGVLLIDMILALTDGILLVFALRYFKTEQADGTPFTRQGADLVLRLGILTIVLPLVAAILSAIVCEILTLPQDAVGDWGNLNCLGMGIVLILASLVFRYGAELETQKQEGNALTE
ncbi:MAG: hypothetical protein ACI3XM_02310 [Eubacteriales bacterium]